MAGRGRKSPEVAELRAFLSHALAYGELGLRVFPLKPGTEEPLIPDWQEKATWDERQIREWWGKWPTANIGIAFGRCKDRYFVVLDYDPRKGSAWREQLLEHHLAAVFPIPWIVQTPNDRRHFYYKSPESRPSAELAPDVYLRGEGDYGVAPPSCLR